MYVLVQVLSRLCTTLDNQILLLLLSIFSSKIIILGLRVLEKRFAKYVVKSESKDQHMVAALTTTEPPYVLASYSTNRTKSTN